MSAGNAIAIGTRVRMQYIEEVTQGTTPATPQMKILRTITRNMNLGVNTLGSQETHSHGQIQDLRHGFNQVDATLQTEWSYSAQDDMLAGVMCSDWATDRLNIGTVMKTYTFERQFLDRSLYEVFTGVSINSAEFRLMPESIVQINFNMLGLKDGTPSGTPLDATPTAAPTYQPFDTFTGVLRDGAVGDDPDDDMAVQAFVTGLTFTVTRGNTLTPVIGSKFSPEVFGGTAVVNGTMTAFFRNHDTYNSFRDEEWSSMAFDLKDLDTPATGYRGVFPKLKHTGNLKDPPREGPIIQEIPFQAVYDQTEATSLYFLRGTALFA